MCIFLGVIQFIIIAYVCLFEYRKQSPMLFLWGTLLIMFGIMHLLACIVGDTEYSDTVLNYASIFAAAFSLFYLMVRSVLSKTTKVQEEFVVDNYASSQFNQICLIICVIFITGLNIRYSGGILNTSWSSGREVSTSSSMITSIFGALFYPFSCSLIVALIQKKTKWIILDVALILFTIIVTRNRVQILPLAICVFAYFYVYKKKRLTLKNVLTIGFFAGIVVYVIYAIRALRWFGSYENLLQSFSSNVFHERMKMFLFENDGELGLRRYFYYFISRNNQFEDFGKGYTYIRMILWWAPTSLTFGLKPDDFAWTMGRAVNSAKYGFSMHPTLFGDAYANFGFIGIFSSILWDCLGEWFDRLACKNSLISLHRYCVIACGMVIIGRGAVYNGFFFIMVGLIVIYLSERIAPKLFVITFGKHRI